jgi:YHS domain-containing protein
MHLENPKKSKEHALVYRDKIYYFSNEEEKKKFMDQPALYVNNESVPLDIHIKPQCFAIGLPRAGKSTLCEKLSEAIGIVHLHIHEIIDELKDSDCILGQRIKDYLGKGLSLDEDLLVQVVAKRI